MDSKFVGAIRNLSPFYPHHMEKLNVDHLYDLGNILLADCKRLGEIGGDPSLHAISTDLNEILPLEKSIIVRITAVLEEKNNLTKTRHLSDQELIKLDAIEVNRKKLADLLYVISDIKSLMYRYILGYFPSAIWDENTLKDMRDTLRLYVDERERFEHNSKQGMFNKSAKAKNVIKSKRNVVKEKFSLRQVAIAFFIMQEPLNKETLPEILKEYTKSNNPASLLNKFNFSGTSQLTSIKKNKRTDSNHLRDLNAAKRLITSRKNKKALKDIDQYLEAFQTAFSTFY